MFFTRDGDETPFGTSISEGLRSWSFVQWRMGSHWFWATILVNVGRHQLTDTLMLAHPDDVAGLIAQGADSSQVTQVQLVSSPLMNETDQWMMQPLTQIIEGSLPGEGEKRVHLIECRDGTIYLDEDVLVEVPTLIQPKVIFSDFA